MFNLFRRTKKEPEDLKEIIAELKKLKTANTELKAELEKLKTESRLFFKKRGFIRYNPFGGVGSDQSFSFALLDDKNNGIVITSLFSREGNRVYAKTVENGQASHSLSEEENKALQQAIKYNNQLPSTNNQ